MLLLDEGDALLTQRTDVAHVQRPLRQPRDQLPAAAARSLRRHPRRHHQRRRADRRRVRAPHGRRGRVPAAGGVGALGRSGSCTCRRRTRSTPRVPERAGVALRADRRPDSQRRAARRRCSRSDGGGAIDDGAARGGGAARVPQGRRRLPAASRRPRSEMRVAAAPGGAVAQAARRGGGPAPAPARRRPARCARERAAAAAGRAGVPRRHRGAAASRCTPAVQARWRRSFGADLSRGARAHATGARPHVAVDARGARAFDARHRTSSSAPASSPTDLALMAHEVAHVVQQQGGAGARSRGRASGGDALRARGAARRRPRSCAASTFTVRERDRPAARPAARASATSLDYFADKANAIPGFRMFTDRPRASTRST